MARNFYKKDGSYYYADNNQKIYNEAELQEAAQSGTEVPYSEPGGNSDGNRDFYKIGNDYFYSDNGQQILNEPELQEASNYGVEIPPTQAAVDKIYADEAANNPAISELTQGGSTIEEIINALSTGNLSGVVDWNGQPFSVEDQQAALTQANEDNKLYYEALKNKETAEAESTLEQDKANYQEYLLNAGQSFESDKSKIDQQAANSGVLFSGGRVQREKNMQRAYEQDQSYQQGKLARNIGTTASDYQYKYGNDAAQGLNKYYKTGGNTYNPNVARGGVGSSGLSSVYNPNKYNYQGTRNTERSAASNTRAAGYLWNKGNKLLGTGYKNQY